MKHLEYDTTTVAESTQFGVRYPNGKTTWSKQLGVYGQTVDDNGKTVTLVGQNDDRRLSDTLGLIRKHYVDRLRNAGADFDGVQLPHIVQRRITVITSEATATAVEVTP